MTKTKKANAAPKKVKKTEGKSSKKSKKSKVKASGLSEERVVESDSKEEVPIAEVLQAELTTLDCSRDEDAIDSQAKLSGVGDERVLGSCSEREPPDAEHQQAESAALSTPRDVAPEDPLDPPAYGSSEAVNMAYVNNVVLKDLLIELFLYEEENSEEEDQAKSLDDVAENEIEQRPDVEAEARPSNDDEERVFQEDIKAKVQEKKDVEEPAWGKRDTEVKKQEEDEASQFSAKEDAHIGRRQDGKDEEEAQWTVVNLIQRLNISLDWIDATIAIGAGTREVLEQIALKLHRVQPERFSQYANQAAMIKQRGASLFDRCNAVRDYPKMRIPPLKHPYWGEDNLMHGLALRHQKGSRGLMSYCYNPAYVNQRRSANTFGHNGITPGTWYPFILCASWDAAHGATQAGVHFSAVGVYSVLISLNRNDVFKNGDIKYSVTDTVVLNSEGKKIRSTAPNENTSASQIARLERSAGAIRASWANGTPIRVLRKPGKGDDSLRAGVRYDGLYKVIEVWEKAEPGANVGEKVWARLARVPEDGGGEPDYAQCSLEKCKKRGGTGEEQEDRLAKCKERF